ncbi:MAG TPA: hypothetical protein VFB21_23250 [Chthonomonadaceae bacterium]|nr:hypothetical protein [Chthonomonadaceae bacterium]
MRKSIRVMAAFVMATLSAVIGYLLNQYTGWVNASGAQSALKTFVNGVNWLFMVWVVFALLIVLREFLRPESS